MCIFRSKHLKNTPWGRVSHSPSSTTGAHAAGVIFRCWSIHFWSIGTSRRVKGSRTVSGFDVPIGMRFFASRRQCTSSIIPSATCCFSQPQGLFTGVRVSPICPPVRVTRFRSSRKTSSSGGSSQRM